MTVEPIIKAIIDKTPLRTALEVMVQKIMGGIGVTDLQNTVNSALGKSVDEVAAQLEKLASTNELASIETSMTKVCLASSPDSYLGASLVC